MNTTYINITPSVLIAFCTFDLIIITFFLCFFLAKENPHAQYKVYKLYSNWLDNIVMCL